MTAEPPPKAMPTKPRRGCAARLLRLAWRLVVVVAVLGVAFYLLRNRLLAPLVIDLARGIAAEELHGELEIESLSGGWLGDLTIHGLRFRRDGETGPIERIEGAEVEVEYSILGLLRGEEGWLERVRFEARDVRLDLGESDEAETSTEPGSLERTLLLRPPELDVAADHVSVSMGDGRRIEVEELAVETHAPGARPRYGIAARSFSVEGAAPRIAPSTLAAATIHTANPTNPPNPLIIHLLLLKNTILVQPQIPVLARAQRNCRPDSREPFPAALRAHGGPVRAHSRRAVSHCAHRPPNAHAADTERTYPQSASCARAIYAQDNAAAFRQSTKQPSCQPHTIRGNEILCRWATSL